MIKAERDFARRTPRRDVTGGRPLAEQDRTHSVYARKELLHHRIYGGG